MLRENINNIINGLKKVNESVSESVYFDDIAVLKVRYSVIENAISDGLTKKYKSKFKYDNLEFYAEISTRDDDTVGIDDIISEITIACTFNYGGDVKKAENDLAKLMRFYPRFKYYKSSDDFYFTVDKNDDVLDLLEILSMDCKISNMYKYIDGNTLRDKYEYDVKQSELARREIEMDYNRDRM